MSTKILNAYKRFKLSDSNRKIFTRILLPTVESKTIRVRDNGAETRLQCTYRCFRLLSSTLVEQDRGIPMRLRIILL